MPSLGRCQPYRSGNHYRKQCRPHAPDRGESVVKVQCSRECGYRSCQCRHQHQPSMGHHQAWYRRCQQVKQPRQPFPFHCFQQKTRIRTPIMNRMSRLACDRHPLISTDGQPIDDKPPHAQHEPITQNATQLRIGFHLPGCEGKKRRPKTNGKKQVHSRRNFN